MAGSAASAKRERGRRVLRAIGYVFWGCVGIAVLSGVILTAERIEDFLIQDPRFALTGPLEYGEESPNLHVSGVRWASRPAILRVFQPDFGRSVYLLPLADRRRALLRVSWVRDAAITRIWPDQVAVEIEERRPAAFIRIPFGAMSRYALIDPDGYILEPPAKARFSLPLISGVSTGEPLAMRSERVHRMQQFLRDIGSMAGSISEIDVSDLDNIQVHEETQGHTVMLLMGDHNFAPRMQTFLDEFPNIERRLPDVAALDLRTDGHIIAVAPGALEGRRDGGRQ